MIDFVLEKLREIILKSFRRLVLVFVDVSHGDGAISHGLPKEGHIGAEAAIPDLEGFVASVDNPGIDHHDSFPARFHIDDPLGIADLDAGDGPADPFGALEVM